MGPLLLREGPYSFTLNVSVASLEFVDARDSEWDDSIEYDLEEIDRLIACANAGK